MHTGRFSIPENNGPEWYQQQDSDCGAVEKREIPASLCSSQETHRLFAEKGKAEYCHFDRSDAKHHVVEKSGLERKDSHNCQPDFSTSLEMTNVELSFCSRQTQALFSEEWSSVSLRQQPRSGATAWSDRRGSR